MNTANHILRNIELPSGGTQDVVSSVYFLGIGGIGMSALARYYLSRGAKVSGYDKTVTPLTQQLEKEGMAVHYEDNIDLLDPTAEIVVYTPAIPPSHTELNYYRGKNARLLKRSEVLGLITRDQFNVCVAGTHGKTTTSAMIAHVLRDTGYGCNAFLGGIASNYNTNFWSSPQNICVAEADEYDRSFLQLSPDIAVVTSMDADHLDIYGTAERMEDAFVEFTARIKTAGMLISKKGLKRAADFVADNRMTYAANDDSADAFARNIRMQNGSYLFDAVVGEVVIADVQLNMGGMHNIENAMAAIAVALELNIHADKVSSAIANFTGVKRRFEYVVKNDEEVMIDDYAHHPEELRALISSAKSLFPGKKCTVVFQPHLYSRTKDLAAEFAEVLSMADQTILLPIYPARELPMPGISSDLILRNLTNDANSIMEKEELLQWVSENKTALLITSGAGDIDALVEPIKQIIVNRA